MLNEANLLYPIDQDVIILLGGTSSLTSPSPQCLKWKYLQTLAFPFFFF